MLHIERCKLLAIGANAFDYKAFHTLKQLTFSENIGAMHILQDAFVGVGRPFSIFYIDTIVANFAAGFFEELIDTISDIEYHGWPGHIGLSDMFIGGQYRVLHMLHIENVPEPSLKFRLLAASNFSTIKHLRILRLVRCGIETIDEHAFDVIGRSLLWLYLYQNRIKFINVEMFRTIFETKSKPNVQLIDNPLWCTCDLIEFDLMRIPAIFLPESREECIVHDGSAIDSCGTYQRMNPGKLCTSFPSERMVRFVGFRLRRNNDVVHLQKKATTRTRLLVLRYDAACEKRKCEMKELGTNAKCWITSKTTESFELHEFAGWPDAEFVMIAALPVVTSRRIWPLHLVTLRQTVASTNHWLEFEVAVLFGVLIVLSMIGGFVATVGYHCCKQRRDASGNDNNASSIERNESNENEDTYDDLDENGTTAAESNAYLDLYSRNDGETYEYI